MVDNDIIKEWITKADQDFEFARINLEEEKQFFAQICFHFNQSAEKYLKAFIIANSLEFFKIHDLHLLLKQCKSKDPSFSQLEDDCECLATQRPPLLNWGGSNERPESRKRQKAISNYKRR